MKVNICGIPYKVSRVADHRLVAHAGDACKLWAEISHEEHSIRLVKSIPERELRALVHEILHGVVEELAVRELQDSEGNHLETAIGQLANGLAGALESMGFKMPEIE